MGILDKLRPQSKSTHPDPNIRIEAIHEIDPDDIESLTRSPRTTPTRASGASRWRGLSDAAVLADIVRNESEGGVRDHALGQLVEQASKHDAAVAMTAVAALAVARPRARAGQAGQGRRARMTCAARRLPRCATKKRWAASRGMRPKPGARLLAIERLSDAAETRRRGGARRARRCRGRRARSPVDAVERHADGDRRQGAHQGGAEARRGRC